MSTVPTPRDMTRQDMSSSLTVQTGPSSAVDTSTSTRPIVPYGPYRSSRVATNHRYRPGDGPHASRFGVPPDLRIQEVLLNPELRQLGQRQVWVVAAGDRVQDAALVQHLQRLAYAGPQSDIVVLQQDAVPDRIIEIPH